MGISKELKGSLGGRSFWASRGLFKEAFEELKGGFKEFTGFFGELKGSLRERKQGFFLGSLRRFLREFFREFRG